MKNGSWWVNTVQKLEFLELYRYKRYKQAENGIYTVIITAVSSVKYGR